MLDDDRPDAVVVREWLAAALRNDTSGKRSALAAACGVKPQAVSGWLRTGRITKRNLAIAAEILGHGPRFVDAPASCLHQTVPRYGPEPAAPAPDFRETRPPSASEWQVLRDLEVFPEEARRQRMADLHAEAEHWRAIEHELIARIKARSQN